MPLVRCQFRGLDEEKRKLFLFEISLKREVVFDAGDGRELFATKEIYAVSLMCWPEEIHER